MATTKTTKIVAGGWVLMVLLGASGCPLMMPAMMGPMLAATKDPGEEITAQGDKVQELIGRGIGSLAQAGIDVEVIQVGRVEVEGKGPPATVVRDELIYALEGHRRWTVMAAPAAASPGPPAPRPASTGAPVLRARLGRSGDIVWLALELVDPATGQRVWSGMFSN